MSFIIRGCKKYGQEAPADFVVTGGVSDGASDVVFEFNNCVDKHEFNNMIVKKLFYNTIVKNVV